MWMATLQWNSYKKYSYRIIEVYNNIIWDLERIDIG